MKFSFLKAIFDFILVSIEHPETGEKRITYDECKGNLMTKEVVKKLLASSPISYNVAKDGHKQHQFQNFVSRMMDPEHLEGTLYLQARCQLLFIFIHLVKLP